MSAGHLSAKKKSRSYRPVDAARDASPKKKEKYLPRTVMAQQIQVMYDVVCRLNSLRYNGVMLHLLWLLWRHLAS